MTVAMDLAKYDRFILKGTTGIMYFNTRNMTKPVTLHETLKAQRDSMWTARHMDTLSALCTRNHLGKNEKTMPFDGRK